MTGNKRTITGARLLVLILSATSVIPLAGQQKMELLGAGRMETITRDGEPVRRLVNDVRLRRGQTLLTCDVAEYYVNRDEALLTGNVRITTRDSRLSGDRAVYIGSQEYLEITGETDYYHTDYQVTAEKLGYRLDLKRLIASGSPVLIDSTSLLSADTVYYFEADSLGDARGNAFLDNRSDSLTVAANRLLYYAGKDSLRGSGNAVLTKNDSQDEPLFTIQSDSLALESGYFFAWQNVLLIHGKTRGTCDRAVYQQGEDLAVMEGDPVLQESRYRLTGDQFNLHLDNGVLSSVFVPAKPYFVQQRTELDSSYEDWLSGNQMAIEFDDGNPREVIVIGMATSYFNVIENDLYEGANESSGDSLFILLTDSTLSRITVSGGAEGVFSPSQNSDAEGPVHYQAELIKYNVDEEYTLLQQLAQVDYLDMSIRAGQIGVYWRLNLLKAQSLVDTVGASDFPVLDQAGEEPFYGKAMVYNIQTRRGKVTAGRTNLDEGNYFGEELIRVNEDVYFVEDGYYTTCSLDHDPHFYFASDNMKMITDKLIIARPVVLYIADIPVMALPFAVFPQKKGRTSGFIIPAYDYRPGLGGRALKGLGYYWAISEYSDAKILMDYWDQYEELSFESRLRYNKRYQYRGNVNFSIASRRNNLLDPNTWGWKLRFNHQQTINPSFTIRADGQLNGDARFDRTYSHDQDQRLNTKLHSGANIVKKFDKLGSVTLNTTYDQDLQVTSQLDEAPKVLGSKLTGPALVFPALSYRLPSRPLVKGGDDHWYNRARLDYSTKFNNSRKWAYTSIEDPDSLLTGDSLKWETETTDRHLWSHDARLSGDAPIFKVFKLNGNLSYSERWVFQYEEALTDVDGFVLTDSSDNILREETAGFLRRGTFSTSAGLNTKFYGIFPFKIGNLEAIRHTVTPKVSLTYTPDFSKDFWGYIRSYEDTTGQTYSFDPYRYTSIGATPTRSALRMNYTLNNDFDYKLFRPDEEDPVKQRFVTWSLGGSYDFEKDSLRASDISNTVQLSLSEKLKLNFRGNFEIYERDSTGNQKIDKFRSPRLTSGTITFQFRLAGHAPSYQVADSSAGDSLALADSSDLMIPGQLTSQPTGREVWGANFSFNYSLTNSNPYAEPVQRLQMNSTLRLNVSRNWKVNYRGSFNLLEQRVVSHSVNINRDLHCWQLSFNWTPSGGYRGFTLLIRPKASQLKDLKVEHKSQRRFLP